MVIIKVNKNLHAVYRMVLFSVTLRDPNYTKPSHFPHLSLFISSHWVGIKTSNLVSTKTVANANRRVANHLWKGGGWLGHVSHLNFGGLQPYLWNGGSSQVLSIYVNGQCGKLVTVIGHHFITQTVDICVQPWWARGTASHGFISNSGDLYTIFSLQVL